MGYGGAGATLWSPIFWTFFSRSRRTTPHPRFSTFPISHSLFLIFTFSLFRASQRSRPKVDTYAFVKSNDSFIISTHFLDPLRRHSIDELSYHWALSFFLFYSSFLSLFRVFPPPSHPSYLHLFPPENISAGDPAHKSKMFSTSHVRTCTIIHRLIRTFDSYEYNTYMHSCIII